MKKLYKGEKYCFLRSQPVLFGAQLLQFSWIIKSFRTEDNPYKTIV